MLAETVIAAFVTYLLMLLAYFWHEKRVFHVSVMSSIVVFDLCMPFYLYATRDWKTRLIDDGDILSFGVWTHFGLIITLYILYVIQIMAGKSLLKNNEELRAEHKAVAKGILLVRALVIISGALLIQPEIVQSELTN